MSEFSDSYHLRSQISLEGVNLLNKADLRGFVFPESNGWVTLVAEGSDLMPNEKLIEANCGSLIQIVSAEDHGWYFSVYENDKRVCHYECSWSEGIEIIDEELNYDVLMKLIRDNNSLEKTNKQELENMLHPQSFKDIFNVPSASTQIASLLGLKYFSWVSFHYVVNDFYGNKEAFPEVISVN